MQKRRLILLAGLVLVTSCSFFSNKPEDTVRSVLSAAEDKSFSSLVGKLSGGTLRSLLVTGQNKWVFARFCRNLRRVPDSYSLDKVFFLRAVYSKGASQVYCSFLARYKLNGRVLHKQQGWRLRRIEGKWKIIAF